MGSGEEIEIDIKKLVKDEIRRACIADPTFPDKWSEFTDKEVIICNRGYFVPAKFNVVKAFEKSAGVESAASAVSKENVDQELQESVKDEKEKEAAVEEEPVSEPSVAKSYTPEKIEDKNIPTPGAVGETPSGIYTIGDKNIPSIGSVGGVSIGEGDVPTAVSFSPIGGIGPGGAQVAQAPAGLDVEADVDEQTGEVEITMTPTGDDIDTDTPIEIITEDGDSYQFYPITDIAAPKAPRSGAEKAAVGILFILLAVLGVLGWMYYKEKE